MGKVKATELEDVRVDFVSFVEEGANGRQFAIFKSAEFKPKETNDFSKEDKGILKRLVENIKKYLISEKEDEEIMKELAEKILAALGTMSKSIEALAAGFGKLEKSLLKEEGGEGDGGEAGKGGDGGAAGAGGEAAAEQGAQGGASGGGEGQPPAGGAAGGEAGAAADAVTKAIEAMTKTIEGLTNRLESVEKRRNLSNGIVDGPGKGSESVDYKKGLPADFWKGVI